jgi:hypothetical protein
MPVLYGITTVRSFVPMRDVWAGDPDWTDEPSTARSHRALSPHAEVS